MKNRAIVTVTGGEPSYNELATITHFFMKLYAKKVNADFIVWNNVEQHKFPHYKKLFIGDLLEHYNRVLYLDTDILVKLDSPDIFNIVPPEKLGMYNEGREYNDLISQKRIGSFTQEYNKVLLAHGFPPADISNWSGKSEFNTGVIVASKKHITLFRAPLKEMMVKGLRDQSYINMRVISRKVPMMDIGIDFNCKFNHKKPAEKAHFIHFIHVIGYKARQEELEKFVKVQYGEKRVREIYCGKIGQPLKEIAPPKEEEEKNIEEGNSSEEKDNE